MVQALLVHDIGGTQAVSIEARANTKDTAMTKYIIFLVGNILEVAVIFPGMAQHSDVRKAFPDWTPISAGFYDREQGCHGLSESLGLCSRPKDSQIVRKHI
jgi:hypothetical protein